MTQGDRRATGGGGTIQFYAIDDKYGLKALQAMQKMLMYPWVRDSQVPDFVIDAYPDASNENSYIKFLGDAKEALRQAGLSDLASKEPLKRFLNRLLGVKLDMQVRLRGLTECL